MSLGYVKGQYWVTDDVFAVYAKRPSYQRFLVALRKAGMAIHCAYSYIAKMYTAEIITYEKLNNSPNYYLFKHNNAYDANPLSAMGRAAVESDYVTPLVRACVLEMETELLADAYRAAVAREAERARIAAKLLPALNSLEDALGRIPVKFMQGETVIGTARVSELRSKPVKPGPLAYNEGDTAEDEEWRYTMRREPSFDEDDDL